MKRQTTSCNATNAPESVEPALGVLRAVLETENVSKRNPVLINKNLVSATFMPYEASMLTLHPTLLSTRLVKNLRAYVEIFV